MRFTQYANSFFYIWSIFASLKCINVNAALNGDSVVSIRIKVFELQNFEDALTIVKDKKDEVLDNLETVSTHYPQQIQDKARSQIV